MSKSGDANTSLLEIIAKPNGTKPLIHDSKPSLHFKKHDIQGQGAEPHPVNTN